MQKQSPELIVPPFLSQAFICPFLLLRVLHPSSAPPLFASILLAASVSQPGVLLTIQTILSEGLWFVPRRPPPVLTSSSALNLEVQSAEPGDEVEAMADRPGTSLSSASTYYIGPSRTVSPMPGIPIDGGDTQEARFGALGRAWAMAAPHPKLLVLPTNPPPSASTSSFRSLAIGHTRLRSLNLSRPSLALPERRRTSSVISGATVAGFEHSVDMEATHATPGRELPGDLLTKALLAEPARPRAVSFKGQGRVPFGFGNVSAWRSTPELPVAKRVEVPSQAGGSVEEGDELNMSGPTDLSIDFLSARILPQLVPSVSIGKRTTIDASELAPHLKPRRRASLGAVLLSTPPQRADGSATFKRDRNLRNLCKLV